VTVPTAPGPEAGQPSAPERRLRAWRRAFPPARQLWLALAVLGGYGVYYLAGLGLTSLFLLPIVAVAADLLFQAVRYSRLRTPDSAIATGLFLALLFPPTASLVLSATVVVAAIAAKHVLRSGGHPWFNPAALGVVAGSVLFALAPAWWVAVGPYGPYLGPVLGLTLVAGGASRWRLPLAFVLAYGIFASLQHAVLGATLDPRVLLLQTLDPTTIFFALFMVPEPRTAPSFPAHQVLYGAIVGIAGAFAPIAFPTLGLLVALLGGNVVALVLRRGSPSRSVSPSLGRRSRAPAPPRSVSSRWSIGRRIAAGLLVLVAVAGVAGAFPSGHGVALPPGGVGSGGGTVGGCTHDNPAIPASTLTQLHKMLGPSVIRSYNAGTGVVVFYDPVNHVTVTETDLYEDYGYAEFNGDDFAVSGCSA